jgi:hypothetical protein
MTLLNQHMHIAVEQHELSLKVSYTSGAWSRGSRCVTTKRGSCSGLRYLLAPHICNWRQE